VHPSGLTPSQFTIVGIASLLLFVVFLALGVAFRRRASYHKRFMVLSMIAVISPAASRIVTQLGLREHWTYLVPIIPALFVAWCLAYDWRKQHTVHPVYAIGGRSTHRRVAPAADGGPKRVVSAHWRVDCKSWRADCSE
jgi:hypothetical protein